MAGSRRCTAVDLRIIVKRTNGRHVSSSEPLVSVALPVYNGAKYIEAALRSLLAQDVEKLEIVVSDDASHDDTVEIVKSLDCRQIKLLTNGRNGGQFVSLNRCLRATRGRYIQLFSHDDIAHSGFLNAQMRPFLEHSAVGAVYSSCRIIDEAGNLLSFCDDDGTPRLIDFDTYLSISSRHGSLPPSISSVMLSRNSIDTIGLFDERFAVAGDLEYYNRVAESFPIARNRELLLDVRTHGGSITLSSATPLRYMKEEIEILPYYQRHLGDQRYREMLLCRARTRGADHAKYLIRRAVCGDWRRFAEGYRLLSQVHNVPLCIWFAVLDRLKRLKRARLS
jgi:glycosyltransferase involved in cell wall biosynthesis